MSETKPKAAPVAAPDVRALRTTLQTLQALSSEPLWLRDLEPGQRIAILEAARAITGQRRRAPRAAPVPLSEAEEAALLATTKKKQAPTRPCYVCGVVTVVVDDALCAACRASEDVAASAVTAAVSATVLRDHVVVVTGGRVNIGFATAVAALRLGARVIATTRFVDDARARFAAVADSSQWLARLSLFGLDLRDLPGVERFAAHLDDIAADGIDAVIHNAAQTLPLSTSALQALTTTALPPTAEALMSALSPNSSSSLEQHNGPYGVPPDESWRARVKDVSTRELLEVLLVNAAAPFVLTRELLPALKRSARTPRVVVNVTSSEGRFSFTHRDPSFASGEFDADADAEFDSSARGERRGKSARHPHLNMAKAALNMMTRTSASEFAKDKILLVAVDPGWVSGPLPGGGFANGRFPLDADEAARRVLHPLIAAATGNPPQWGVLYKNYRPAPW